MRRAFYADDGVIDQSYNVFRYDKYGEPNTNKYLRMILNTEHAIDVEQLESALTELKPLIEKFRILGKYINWPRLHVRFTKKSERTMIAMNSGRDTAYVGIYIIGSCLHEPQIEVARAIEKVLIAHGGRPHWGKFRYTTSDLYKETYPAFKTFLDLRAQLDPDGMFSDGFNLYEGLDYFLETPWAKILNSLTADDTYFPVRIL
jgi:FAD/FMN-containing dehydrogenase